MRTSAPCVDALCPAQRRVLDAFCAGQLPAGQLHEALQRARVHPDLASPAPLAGRVAAPDGAVQHAA
jgi:hypothetical protein